MKARAALYVDGFNFYYGVTNHYRPLREERGYSLSGLAWCDFRALIERHFGLSVAFIKYFTAPVTAAVEWSMRPGEPERYRLWRRAVETIPSLRVIEGRYVPRETTQTRPDAPGKLREEKQTDVQIAIEMLLDATQRRDEFDQVLLLTGDQDQWPAVCAVAMRLHANVPVGILLPPSGDKATAQRQLLSCQQQLLQRYRSADPVFHTRCKSMCVEQLSEEMLANSLLPYRIETGDGDAVTCPEYWRLHHNYLDRVCKRAHRPDHAPLKQGAAS